MEGKNLLSYLKFTYHAVNQICRQWRFNLILLMVDAENIQKFLSRISLNEKCIF